jgi:predicted glycosyltransferase
LTRHAEQRGALQALDLRHCVLPCNAVDSRSLMHAADLVLGAGGTMTREAALLGIPTLSLFAGKQPAVDRWLEQKGLLRRIRSATEAVPVERRSADPRSTEELLQSGARLIDVFHEAIETVARNGESRRFAPSTGAGER